MTQLRKEQINDIQAKFFALDPRLESVTSPPTVGQPLGLVQSTTFTAPGVSYSPLAVFLGSSVTGQFGGAIDTSRGYIVGSVQGPFVSAAGDQISVICPLLNGGNPIIVTILSSDIVNVSGSPLLTTSRLAARINATVVPYLVAAGLPSTPLATNQNGYLQVVTPTVGDSASITVREVTSGKLNVYFGAGSGSSLSAVGVTAPKRGIATVDPSGKGAKAYVRMANGAPALTRQGARMHMGDGNYVPDQSIGQDIYARVTGVAGTSATIAFYTLGRLRPSVSSGAPTGSGIAVSNFAALNSTDTITISVGDPSLPPSSTVSVTFSPSPTSVNDVIDKINTAWGAAAGTYLPANKAAVVVTPTTFAFPSSSNFVLILNGTAPITVSVAGVTNQSTLVSAVNAAIAGAGLSAQGSCTLFGPSGAQSVAIISSVTGANSSIQLAPAPSGISYLPDDMSALNGLGLSPGLYKATVIAQLYGQDEITIFNPSRNSSATISVSGSSATLTKMGFPTALSVGVSQGEEPAVPGGQVNILIPEAMGFGEVPDNLESLVEDFLQTNIVSSVDPNAGIVNMGLPAILDPDGQVPLGLLNKFTNYFEAILGGISSSLSGFSGSGGAASIGNVAVSGSTYSLSAGSVSAQISSLLGDVNDAAARAAAAAQGSAQSGTPYTLTAGTLVSQLGTLLTAVNDRYRVRVVASASSNLSLDDDGAKDNLVVFTVAGPSKNFALPAPSACPGREVFIAHIASATSDWHVTAPTAVIFQRFGSTLSSFDIGSNTAINGQWLFKSDGVRWHVVALTEDQLLRGVTGGTYTIAQGNLHAQIAAGAANLNSHVSSGDHDSRYYTQSQSNSRFLRGSTTSELIKPGSSYNSFSPSTNRPSAWFITITLISPVDFSNLGQYEAPAHAGETAGGYYSDSDGKIYWYVYQDSYYYQYAALTIILE